MVKLEEITDADKVSTGPYSSAGSSASASSESLASVSSTGSDAIEKESFADRLAALVDIIPPKTRHSITSSLSKGASALKTSGKFVGNAIWIFSTSALLVALPLALVLEDEAKIVQQERELIAQQQGQQVCQYVIPPAFSSILRRAFIVFPNWFEQKLMHCMLFRCLPQEAHSHLHSRPSRLLCLRVSDITIILHVLHSW